MAQAQLGASPNIQLGGYIPAARKDPKLWQQALAQFASNVGANVADKGIDIAIAPKVGSYDPATGKETPGAWYERRNTAPERAVQDSAFNAQQQRVLAEKEFGENNKFRDWQKEHGNKTLEETIRGNKYGEGWNKEQSDRSIAMFLDAQNTTRELAGNELNFKSSAQASEQPYRDALTKVADVNARKGGMEADAAGIDFENRARTQVYNDIDQAYGIGKNKKDSKRVLEAMYQVTPSQDLRAYQENLRKAGRGALLNAGGKEKSWLDWDYLMGKKPGDTNSEGFRSIYSADGSYPTTPGSEGSSSAPTASAPSGAPAAGPSGGAPTAGPTASSGVSSFVPTPSGGTTQGAPPSVTSSPAAREWLSARYLTPGSSPLSVNQNVANGREAPAQPPINVIPDDRESGTSPAPAPRSTGAYEGDGVPDYSAQSEGQGERYVPPGAYKESQPDYSGQESQSPGTYEDKATAQRYAKALQDPQAALEEYVSGRNDTYGAPIVSEQASSQQAPTPPVESGPHKVEPYSREDFSNAYDMFMNPTKYQKGQRVSEPDTFNLPDRDRPANYSLPPTIEPTYGEDSPVQPASWEEGPPPESVEASTPAETVYKGGPFTVEPTPEEPFTVEPTPPPTAMERFINPTLGGQGRKVSSLSEWLDARNREAAPTGEFTVQPTPPIPPQTRITPAGNLHELRRLRQMQEQQQMLEEFLRNAPVR